MKAARKMMVMVIMFVMIFSVGIIPAEAAAKSPAVKQCETVEKRIKKAYKHVKIVRHTKNNDDRFGALQSIEKARNIMLWSGLPEQSRTARKTGETQTVIISVISE